MSVKRAVSEIEKELLGTWKLTSVSAWIDDEEVDTAPYGNDPVGFIHYLPNNRMAVVIAYGGRKHVRGDRLKASLEDRAEAYATCIAYAGSYELQNDKIIHTIETSAFPNEVGSKQIRYYRLEGNKIYLSTVPLIRVGLAQVYKLIWEKVA